MFRGGQCPGGQLATFAPGLRLFGQRVVPKLLRALRECKRGAPSLTRRAAFRRAVTIVAQSSETVSTHVRRTCQGGHPRLDRLRLRLARPACPRVRQIRIVGPAQIFSESVCLWLAAPICVFRVSGPRISVPSPGLGRAAGIEFFIWSEGCPTRQEARPCCGTSRAAHGERAWLHLQEKAALRDDSTFMFGGG